MGYKRTKQELFEAGELPEQINFWNSTGNTKAKYTVPLSNKGKQTMGNETSAFNLPDWFKNLGGNSTKKPNLTSTIEPGTSVNPGFYTGRSATTAGELDQLRLLSLVNNPQNREVNMADKVGGRDIMGNIDLSDITWGNNNKGKDDGIDYLGWAGIGTGLLKGAGGILDYFSNMRGLELTEEAMNKKYAADDRNYLAQATALNNIIDTRKDYIDKTQGGRNTDFLQRIPV